MATMKKILLTLALAGCVCCASAQITKPASGKQAAGKTNAPAAPLAPAEDKEKKAEFVDRLFSEQSYLNAQIVDKCFTFKFSPTCWATFTDPAIGGNDAGFGQMKYWTDYVVKYAKREGYGDLNSLANVEAAVEKANRPMIDDIIKAVREKFSLTVEAPMPCTGKAPEMILRYPSLVLRRLGQTTPDWSPKAGAAFFTVLISPTSKAITVKISPDGKQYFVAAPAYVEIDTTGDPLYTGLERGNKNR